MSKLKRDEIENIDEKVQEINAYQDENDSLDDYQSADYEEPESVYSFEIKEDFDELKEKLSRSMKKGLIHELAKDDGSYDGMEVTDNAIGVYSQEDYWYDIDRGTYETGERVKINDKQILLETYETYSLGMDSFGNYDADVHNVFTIEPKENGGCIVSGPSILGGNLEEEKFSGIFAGVRNEITYVPDTLTVAEGINGLPAKCDDSMLLEDEKHKINGLQEYKNLTKANYDQKSEFNIDKVLSIIDPAGHTVAGDIDEAVYSRDAKFYGSRRDVNFCHEKMNYGLDTEIESLGFSDGNYPDDCVHGVTEHEGTWTDWGYETTIPEHWSRFDADEYFNLRFKGMPVSERMFDSYLKSQEVKTDPYERVLQRVFDKEKFSNFLKTVTKQVLKNKKKGMSSKESLDAALTLIDAKKRVRQNIKQNQAMTNDIKSGIAKTKESGYKHISRPPSLNKGGRED